MLIRWECRPFRIPESLSADAPAVFTTIQVAHVHPSTAGRRVVKDAEKRTNAVHEGVDGIPEAHHYDCSAVAGTGPPLSTEIHFWIAAPRMITASTIITAVQIVSTHPSTWRSGFAPTASG